MSKASVYIFHCQDFVKIGVAANPAQRLADVNIGTPVRATLFGHRTFNDRLTAFNVESRLHRQFKAFRSNGEWFAIPPDDALAALQACRAYKLHDRKIRHDSIRRWDLSDEDPTITNLLTQGLT